MLARRAFPEVPVYLGGIEASLRRFAHYDYWADRVMPSILAVSYTHLDVYKRQLLAFGLLLQSDFLPSAQGLAPTALSLQRAKREYSSFSSHFAYQL